MAAFERAFNDPAVGVVLGHRKHPGTASSLGRLEAFKRHKSEWLFSLYEHVVNTREHVDFCLEVGRDGGTIWLEPASIVTYLYDADLEPSDSSFFMMRWSDRWARSTLARLEEKYGLAHDKHAIELRMRSVGSRRRNLLIRPLIRRTTRGIGGRWIQKPLEIGGIRIEQLASRLLHALNDRRAPPSASA